MLDPYDVDACTMRSLVQGGSLEGVWIRVLGFGD